MYYPSLGVPKGTATYYYLRYICCNFPSGDKIDMLDEWIPCPGEKRGSYQKLWRLLDSSNTLGTHDLSVQPIKEGGVGNINRGVEGWRGRQQRQGQGFSRALAAALRNLQTGLR